ncbi:hypothetical protein JCGZ_24264 [Jatropha curcas]|uniref:Uncharacterized protein n=1 Tax=Jatropha curcas TaxID=180498 RepID=A0A067JMP1_JATCU|nr:hypothetical protein JCGZ_24264 [Jatropha curcas]
MVNVEVGDLKGNVPNPAHGLSHDHHEDSAMIHLHVSDDGRHQFRIVKSKNHSIGVEVPYEPGQETMVRLQVFEVFQPG